MAIESTATPLSAASASTALVVATPECDVRRNRGPSPVTLSTPGSPASRLDQLAGAGEKLTSKVLTADTAALSFIGESSAISLPWSTIAIRSQSLSASSM